MGNTQQVVWGKCKEGRRALSLSALSFFAASLSLGSDKKRKKKDERSKKRQREEFFTRRLVKKYIIEWDLSFFSW